MFAGGSSLLAFAPMTVIAGGLCLRIFMTARQDQRRRKREAQRLATMLVVELRHLSAHYGDNLLLLRDGGGLLSLKPGLGVFRGNINRLPMLLGESVLAPLTDAYAHHERIESLMQSCAAGGLPGRRAYAASEPAHADRLRERFLAGQSLIAAAIAAIKAAWPLLADEDEAFSDAPMRDDRLIEAA